jgi:hypothetical protein
LPEPARPLYGPGVPEQPDVIVVGAGSAGAVVARG